MQRPVLLRFLPVYVAFSLGATIGALIAAHFLGKCDTTIVDVDTNALQQAIVAAIPAAVSGSGLVSISIDVTGIRVHADSVFQNQSYDSRLPAIIRGSPVTIELSTQLLRRTFRE